MSALLLDSGNSCLKWGLLDNAEIRQSGRIAQDTIRAQGLSVLSDNLPAGFETAMACNVAGRDFAAQLSRYFADEYGCPVRFARCESEAFGVTNAYPDPLQLGVDRWVAMIGARAQLDSACLVIDAGTALTIDVLDAGGRHLGGQILPGVMLMAGALASHTSDLPAIRKPAPAGKGGPDILATSTSGAISQGVVSAAAGAVEHVLRAVRREGHAPAVLITGGDAEIIAAGLAEDARRCPNLVLEGLAVMLGNER